MSRKGAIGKMSQRWIPVVGRDFLRFFWVFCQKMRRQSANRQNVQRSQNASQLGDKFWKLQKNIPKKGIYTGDSGVSAGVQNVPKNGYFPGMFGSWNSGPLTGPWLTSGWRRSRAPRAQRVSVAQVVFSHLSPVGRV